MTRAETLIGLYRVVLPGRQLCETSFETPSLSKTGGIGMADSHWLLVATTPLLAFKPRRWPNVESLL